MRWVIPHYTHSRRCDESQCVLPFFYCHFDVLCRVSNCVKWIKSLYLMSRWTFALNEDHRVRKRLICGSWWWQKAWRKKNIKKLAINTLPWLNRMDFRSFLLMFFECQYIRDEWRGDVSQSQPIKPPRDANLKSVFLRKKLIFVCRVAKYYLNHARSLWFRRKTRKSEGEDEETIGRYCGSLIKSFRWIRRTNHRKYLSHLSIWSAWLDDSSPLCLLAPFCSMYLAQPGFLFFMPVRKPQLLLPRPPKAT